MWKVETLSLGTGTAFIHYLNGKEKSLHNLPVSAYQDAELDSKGRAKGMRCLLLQVESGE